MDDNLCENCGEPLDDFSPCACSLDGRRPPRAEGKRVTTSMRAMVTRKLEKKRLKDAP